MSFLSRLESKALVLVDRMKWRPFVVAPVLLLVHSAPMICLAEDGYANRLDLECYRQAAHDRWQDDIAELGARDASESYPDDAVLFIGSSSIRLWSDIAADMQPYPVIQRGYGGAKWSDVAIFIDQLVRPHSCCAVVFFVGNDISGCDDDKSPREIMQLFAHVLGRVREHNAIAPVFYVAVTPTRSRWSVWPQIRQGNSLVRDYCQRQPNLHFIDTESIFLDERGEPRVELFLDDELHLNREGYTCWASAIKSQLDTVFNGAGHIEQVKRRDAP